MNDEFKAKERPPLEEMTLRQLRRIASENNIFRYSRKRKQELLNDIQKILRNLENKINQPLQITREELAMEPGKFGLSQEENIVSGEQDSPRTTSPSVLSEEDQYLPGGYGDSRIVLLPRDSQWAYAYWDVSNEHKLEARRQGGQTLILRLYDVAQANTVSFVPQSVQEYSCDEMAREWYLPVPVSDRTYIVEIVYRTFDGNWLVLARSAPASIPPLYPSQWIEDVFVTVDWEEELVGKTVYKLVSPEERQATAINDNYEVHYEPSNLTNFSGQMNPSSPEFGLSSYILGSEVGSWSLPTSSGRVSAGNLQRNVSGLSQFSAERGVASYTSSGSGIGLSGYTASGIGMGGFSASAIPPRPRKFWLVADAGLIVYGATEPDATVTIGGRPIKLNEDGTFRFHMSFPDGLIDYPIMAVAVDGEQTRSIHMKFNRETPDRNTNTKEEAILEWL